MYLLSLGVPRTSKREQRLKIERKTRSPRVDNRRSEGSICKAQSAGWIARARRVLDLFLNISKVTRDSHGPATLHLGRSRPLLSSNNSYLLSDGRLPTSLRKALTYLSWTCIQLAYHRFGDSVHSSIYDHHREMVP